jgi:hypothetical protein
VTVRIIEVPPGLHARFEHSGRLPIFQMIAKNVGIRRARAPFVLATNVDLLFSDGVMRELGSRGLRRGRVYRVDRYDVEAGVPVDGPVTDQLRWCSEHVLRVNSRRGTADLTTGAFYPIYSGVLDLPAYVWHRVRLGRSGVAGFGSALPALPPLLAGALDVRRGDYVGRTKRVVRRRVLRRQIEARRRARRPPPPRKPPPAVRIRRGALELRRGAVEARRRAHDLRRTVVRARIRPHTNACGDFTLLAREDWLALRGYPELEMYSLHIDSLLLYMSRHAGMRERVLADPVFHMEHGTGFKPDDEGRQELFAWLSAAGIPWVTNQRFADYVIGMAETRRPLDVNGDGWGLAGEELPEESFVL